MEKIRMGILGAGRIMDRVIVDMHNAKKITVTAIAARELSRARTAADRYGVPLAYGSYEELAESDQVDLVYIATPHPLHAEQAVRMMRAGKHVLCEKPMTVTPEEARLMIDCARENKVFLMEAMWTRFTPAMKEALRQIREGAIGEVRHVYGDFSYYNSNPDPADRVFAPELAGGALLDLGVYPLMACTSLLGADPEQVHAVCRKTEQGVDMRTCVQMMYADGKTAQFMCGMDASCDNTLRILGTKGFIVMPEFWHPWAFTLYQNGAEPRAFTFAQEHEGHHYEFDHAAECILGGLTESPVVPLSESLQVSELCTRARHDMGIFYPSER